MEWWWWAWWTSSKGWVYLHLTSRYFPDNSDFWNIGRGTVAHDAVPAKTPTSTYTTLPHATLSQVSTPSVLPIPSIPTSTSTIWIPVTLFFAPQRPAVPTSVITILYLQRLLQGHPCPCPKFYQQICNSPLLLLYKYPYMIDFLELNNQHPWSIHRFLGRWSQSIVTNTMRSRLISTGLNSSQCSYWICWER